MGREKPNKPRKPTKTHEDTWGPWGFAGKGTEPGEVVFTNGVYTVIVTRIWFQGGYMWHASMRNENRTAMSDWRHKQRIKSELFGSESEAVELFPAESRVLDASNQFHLWVLPKGTKFGFGFDSGRNVGDMSDYRAAYEAGGTEDVPMEMLERIMGKAVQRDLGEWRTAGLGHDGVVYTENFEAIAWGNDVYLERRGLGSRADTGMTWG